MHCSVDTSFQGARLRDQVHERATLKTLKNAPQDLLDEKIPVEIMTLIFLLADRMNDYYSPPTWRPLPAGYVCYPTIFSSVCARWRNIALAVPKLWTNLYINLWSQVESADHLDVIAQWLNRSRPMSLHLTLYSYSNRMPTRGLLMDPNLSSLLRSHSTRWEYLNIQYAPTDTLYSLFNDLERIPTSNSLHLRIASQGCDSRPTAPIIKPRTPIEPFRLYSAMPPHDMKPKSLMFGWNNLIYLEISYHSVHTLRSIMTQAPRLKHCVSTRGHNGPPVPLNVTTIPVVHNSLEYLEVEQPVLGIKFFPHFTFPSLRHFRCHFNFNDFLLPEYSDLFDFLACYERDSLQTFTLEYSSSLHRTYGYQRFFELEAATHLTINLQGFTTTGEIHPFFAQMSKIDVFPHLQEIRINIMESTAMRPAGWEILSSYITEHNFNCRSTIGQKYRRTLKSISVSTDIPDLQTTMKREVLLSLRESQREGPLKLEIGNRQQDVLQDPQFETVVEDDWVILTFPLND